VVVGKFKNRKDEKDLMVLEFSTTICPKKNYRDLGISILGSSRLPNNVERCLILRFSLIITTCATSQN